MKNISRAVTVAVSTVGLCTALAVPGALAAPTDPIRTIATGFGGPLHLAVGPTGKVFVADAFLGQIDRVDPATGSVTTVLSNLAFSAGVDVHGGQIYFTNNVEPQTAGEQASASLMRGTPGGAVKHLADLLAYELANNPDGQPLGVQDADANPYAVLALPGRTLVADAAGNDIVEVRSNGSIRTLTVFPVSFEGECATRTNNGVPNGGCDPAPTDIALGPDGFLYVSGLGGEVEGVIWKVNATTGAIVETRGDLPPLTGITVSEDGTVYAASLFTGTIFRLGAGGLSVAEVPGAADVDWADGVLYATTVDFGGGPGSLVAVSPEAFHPAS